MSAFAPSPASAACTVPANKMYRSRTFWRIFGTYGVLLTLSLAVLGIWISRRVERQFLDGIAETLRTKAILVREAVRDRPAAEAPLLQKRMVALRREIATRITLIDAFGTVL